MVGRARSMQGAVPRHSRWLSYGSRLAADLLIFGGTRDFFSLSMDVGDGTAPAGRRRADWVAERRPLSRCSCRSSTQRPANENVYTNFDLSCVSDFAGTVTLLRRCVSTAAVCEAGQKRGAGRCGAPRRQTGIAGQRQGRRTRSRELRGFLSYRCTAVGSTACPVSMKVQELARWERVAT